MAGPVRHAVDAAAAAAVAITIALMLWPAARAFRDQPKARRELLAFASGLTVGMTRDQVQTRFSRSSPALLSLTQVDASVTIVETPYTFGAGNWRGWLQLDGERLASIRIRTMDGEHVKPAGSPPDVGRPAQR